MSHELPHRGPGDCDTAEPTQSRLSLERMNVLAAEAVKCGGYVEGIHEFLAIMHGAQTIDDIQTDVALAERYEHLRTVAGSALDAVVLQNPTDGSLALYAQATGYRESLTQPHEDPLTELRYRIGLDPNTDEWIGVAELPTYRYFQPYDRGTSAGLRAGSESDVVTNGLIILEQFRRAHNASDVDLTPRNSPRARTTIQRWNIGKQEILQHSKESSGITPLEALEEMLTAVVAIRAARDL